MRARLRKRLQHLAEAFRLVPAGPVLPGISAGLGMVRPDRRGVTPSWLVDQWLYGGGSGARALLGAIASSTIGVAGTVLSITVAALTLASSQMGPRLLRSFMRDRGNQVTLGVFLDIFACALLVLRTIRGRTRAGSSPTSP